MEIGFNLPISGPMATAETMANIAQLGEALGFAYLTLTDHIALPDTSTPGYPYSTTGEFYTPDPGNRVEQLTTAAWVAAKTTMDTRIRTRRPRSSRRMMNPGTPPDRSLFMTTPLPVSRTRSCGNRGRNCPD